jgi:hypothetical protein
MVNRSQFRQSFWRGANHFFKKLAQTHGNTTLGSLITYHDGSPLANCGGVDDSDIRRSIISANYDAKYSTTAKNHDNYSSSNNIISFERTSSD